MVSIRIVFEVLVFDCALKNGIKMTGICRGSQFLNVMSGGRMMHDVHSHGGTDHSMNTSSGEQLIVNSYHHQMSVLGEGGHIIGWSTERRSADHYIGKADEQEDYTGPEVEAIYYPDTLCAAVQYHPEWMKEDSDGYQWYFNMVKDFLECSREEFEAKYVGKEQKANTA